MLCSTPGMTYKEETHAEISAAAAKRSVLTQDSRTLPRLGLEPLTRDQQFPNSPGDPQTILELLQFGATFEDSGVRALNHFYDPMSSQPLTVPGIPLFNHTSPDWALEDFGEIDGTLGVGAQTFSYRDARKYFYSALTASTASERQKNFGLMFQTLGQVIHHLQDMAQPQHVRNDAHMDWGREVGGIQLNPLYNPSLYEAYTNDVRFSLPYAGPPSSPLYADLDLAVFPNPRMFWFHVLGKGIAQFTNYNFVSAATNFGSGRYNFPLFDASLRTDVDIQQLCASAVPACSNPGLAGQMTFFGNRVHDDYTGETTLNPYASTYSIFDADLIKAGRQPVFSLNRFNFDLAHGFLIPRAVAYSSGLINYFFRGQMKISLPDEGVYAVADHAVPEGNDPQIGGFAKIKLKLQNMTPAGTDALGNAVIEPIRSSPAATLIAIAKFHRNNCYRADLGGEYGSPGVNWSTCRSPTEEIVVSSPAMVPSGINSAPQSVAFDFPVKIPISATDLYLQVVYRGPLGEESDAVVVETKDISEPTYLYNYSRWDQYVYSCGWPEISINGGGCGAAYTYAQWCSTGGFPALDDCNHAMGFTFKYKYSATATPIPGYDPLSPADPPGPPGQFVDMSKQIPASPVAVMPGPVGSLSRVAVLTDAAPTNAELLIIEHHDATHGNHGFEWFGGTAAATVNQFDSATNTLTPSITYLPGRGVFLPSAESLLLNSGPVHPALLLTPSQINF